MEIIAALDIETTGLNPLKHDIIELAVVPLDASFRESQDFTPFSARIKAEHPENADAKALAVNGLNPYEGEETHMSVWQNFLAWMGDYRIDAIAPLGHNVAFDLRFIQCNLYEIKSCFRPSHARDTQSIAMFYGDLVRQETGGEPFQHASLACLRQHFRLPGEQSHRALDDARDTARIYRMMMEKVREGL